MDLDRGGNERATPGTPGDPVTGVRRGLNRAADRALAAGPPTKAQEAWYVASWLGALAASWVLLRVLGPKWSR